MREQSFHMSTLRFAFDPMKASYLVISVHSCSIFSQVAMFEGCITEATTPPLSIAVREMWGKCACAKENVSQEQPLAHWEMASPSTLLALGGGVWGRGRCYNQVGVQRMNFGAENASPSNWSLEDSSLNGYIAEPSTAVVCM